MSFAKRFMHQDPANYFCTGTSTDFLNPMVKVQDNFYFATTWLIENKQYLDDLLL